MTWVRKPSPMHTGSACSQTSRKAACNRSLGWVISLVHPKRTLDRLYRSEENCEYYIDADCLKRR